jgi:hypothetical protein
MPRDKRSGSLWGYVNTFDVFPVHGKEEISDRKWGEDV